MLKPDPTAKRQLEGTGPLLLWRDAKGGRREALVLTAQVCANSGCPCRDIVLEGWLSDDQVLGVSHDGRAVKFVRPSGVGSGEQKVLLASVDIDTARVAAVEGATVSEPWAEAWLRSELDQELLSALRARFAAAKRPMARGADWRTLDWSWWAPGKRVGWLDLDPNDERLEVTVGGVVYVIDDLYCVEPGCTCDEIELQVMREPGEDKELEVLGEVTLNPAFPTVPHVREHGAARAEVKRVWEAFSRKYPVGALLLDRRDDVRQHATELHRLFAKRAPASAERKAPTKAGRNDPCPCGSGLKYKRCCMEAGKG